MMIIMVVTNNKTDKGTTHGSWKTDGKFLFLFF